jgi:hypothetical protein
MRGGHDDGTACRASQCRHDCISVPHHKIPEGEIDNKSLIQIENDARKAAAQLVSDTGAQNAVKQIIDQDLLDALDQNLKNARNRVRRALLDVRNTPNQKDQEIAIARAEVCNTLQTIKDWNGGNLPSAVLDALWQSNRCDQFLAGPP